MARRPPGLDGRPSARPARERTYGRPGLVGRPRRGHRTDDRRRPSAREALRPRSPGGPAGCTHPAGRGGSGLRPPRSAQGRLGAHPQHARRRPAADGVPLLRRRTGEHVSLRPGARRSLGVDGRRRARHGPRRCRPDARPARKQLRAGRPGRRGTRRGHLRPRGVGRQPLGIDRSRRAGARPGRLALVRPRRGSPSARAAPRRKPAG